MPRRRFKVEVDQRTADLTDEAVLCRTWGHAWKRRAASRKRTQEFLANGQIEYVRYCENGCGCVWRQVWSIEERMVIEDDRQYARNGAYLLPPKSGRMRRAEAFGAFFAREHPEMV